MLLSHAGKLLHGEAASLSSLFIQIDIRAVHYHDTHYNGAISTISTTSCALQNCSKCVTTVGAMHLIAASLPAHQQQLATHIETAEQRVTHAFCDGDSSTAAPTSH